MSGQGDESVEPLLELRAVMARLRAECPWKAEQTHRSLVRYLLEETHETVEAVDRLAAGEPGAVEHLREELGDLLLQVYFHAAVAAEAGGFDIDDVARGITDKMVRRNPHVFGDEADQSRDAATVNERWQQIKAAEKSHRTTVDEGVPAGLPALLYADKVLDRLHRAGHDVGLDPASTDVGERLLALVEEARVDGLDPEQALRDAVRRRT
ncbi:MazG family protein [uncultured Nocardioides sp.]|uniref:MazG family protein n=1 Tax=uncultured Nocardioides sp. TaxID=198441 RepID=UPI0030F5D8D5